MLSAAFECIPVASMKGIAPEFEFDVGSIFSATSSAQQDEGEDERESIDEMATLIRVVNFDTFKRLGKFPRFPNQKSVHGLYSTIDEISIAESFVVFVSHAWLRSTAACKDWDGEPHPDSPAADKYHLCVEGIDKMLNQLAPDMNECYLWIDYCCLDQTKSPALELGRLDKILACTDCMFTPIFEPDETYDVHYDVRNHYEEYRAKAWNRGSTAYMNRAWCRLEMIYSANTPFSGRLEMDARVAKFRGGLRFNASKGRRPHFLYGSNESAMERPPILLPLLDTNQFETYHPKLGKYSFRTDKSTLDRLIKWMEQKLIKPIQVGYEGERSESKRHGFG